MDIVPQLIINSLIAGSIYALLAMSFNFIFGATKFFNFAHGSYALIAGYVTFYFVRRLGWPDYLGIIIGLLSAGLSAYILDKIINLPLRKKKATDAVKLVSSLDQYFAIGSFIAILFTSQFQSLARPNSVQKIFIFYNAAFAQTHIFMFLSALFALFFFLTIFKFTLFGKAVKAISDDEEVAKIVGINTNKIISGVFFIGAVISGLEGILTGYDTGIQPIMGLGLFLKGVIAAIIGGLGSIPGAFLGAYLLGFVENFGIWKISGEWKDAIAFGLLIIFLIFRPNGILRK